MRYTHRAEFGRDREKYSERLEQKPTSNVQDAANARRPIGAQVPRIGSWELNAASVRVLAALAGLGLGAGIVFSQTDPVPPPRPLPPPSASGSQGFQLQIRPGSGPVIIGPAGGIAVQGAEETEPAASASFEPATAWVGRPVTYRVTITGTQRALELPDPLPAPPRLELAAGGRSVSTQVLNGAFVLTTTFQYSAVASHAGIFTVPGYDVLVGTKQVRVPPAVLTVADPPPGEAAYQSARVELELPQRDFFAGETIPARLLVIETPDESPQFIQHVAKTSGAAVFRPSMRTKREQFVREGQQLAGLVMPLQITPILEGEGELGCQVLVHVQKLDPTGRRSGFTMQTQLDSKPAKIRVLALPRVGRLPGFTGAIGQFTIAQPKLSATEVEAGEPVTLSLTITGEGNLDGVAGPEFEEGGGWQAYKPTSDFQPDANDPATSRGTKTFTYTLVPNRAGQRSTPALPFCYFDPVKRAYVDVTVPPLPILVKPSSAPPPAVSPESAKPEALPVPDLPRTPEPSMTGLEEQPGRWAHSIGPSLGVRWFLAIQVIPPAVLLGLWAWRRRKEYLAANPQIIRRRRARAAVRRALAEARAAARKGDREKFLAAGAGALREAAAPLDTAQAGSLTREEVLRLLRDDEKTSALARKILESADAANYSHKAGNGFEPSAMLPELERAVQTLARRT
jgi:hypothetical protein